MLLNEYKAIREWENNFMLFTEEEGAFFSWFCVNNGYDANLDRLFYDDCLYSRDLRNLLRKIIKNDYNAENLTKDEQVVLSNMIKFG